MTTATSKRVLIPVLLERFRFPKELDQLACLGCGAGLALTQPDVDRPETLIGSCTPCHHDYLIAQLPAGGDALIVLLPDSNDILRAANY